MRKRGRTRLLLVAVVAGLFVWSFILEPRWLAHRQLTMSMPNWRSSAPIKVAIAGDWHLSKHAFWRVTTIDRARQIVASINAENPDLILLPGDFIAGHDHQATGDLAPEDEIAKVIGQLRAPLGVYAVLGNHDWWYDGEKFSRALSRNGIQVLENQSVEIGKTGLWLVGIGDHMTRHSFPRQAVAELPNPGVPALFIMHDPASLFDLQKLNGIGFAAHTHGGQVYLPIIGALITPGKAPRAWAYGWIEHGGNRAFVTSGIGVSILPVRFNMRPEWLTFTITPSP